MPPIPACCALPADGITRHLIGEEDLGETATPLQGHPDSQEMPDELFRSYPPTCHPGRLYPGRYSVLVAKELLMRLFLGNLVGLLLLSMPVMAQEEFNVNVPKNIVILQSTRDYAAALAGAKQAATKLQRPLKLNDNHPNKELGLSWTKVGCEDNGYDFPCYLPRGNGMAEDSDYISVEYSDGYEGFAKGYYIVVAALAAPNSTTLRQTLARVRRAYPAAYAKRTAVWRGCMH